MCGALGGGGGETEEDRKNNVGIELRFCAQHGNELVKTKARRGGRNTHHKMARTALTHAENERKRARKYGSKCSILFTVRCTFFSFRPYQRNYRLITKLKK